MPRRVHLPTQISTAPFHISTGVALGMTSGRLRGGDLARPFDGVRVARGHGEIDAIAAYATRMRAAHHFSHWSAAEIHGLPVPRYDGPLHVTAVAPAVAPRMRGVSGHSARTANLMLVKGLRVSTPVDTWVTMATELSVRDLVILGDALVRRNRPVASMDELAAAVLAHRGKRGAASLTAAFASVRPRTDSVAETRLRLAIVGFGLPEPEVNVEVRDDRGRLIAIADLAYPEWKVVAEYDGDQHRTDDRQFFRDVDRLDDLAHERWRVIRFNRSHMTDARLHKLHRALLSAGWRP